MTDPVAKDNVWAYYAPIIARALPYGGDDFTTDELRADILAGRKHFIGGVQSAMAVEVVLYSNRKVGRIVFAAGDMDEVLRDLEPKAVAFAQREGCTAMEFIGRRGWLRAAAPLGYQDDGFVRMSRRI